MIALLLLLAAPLPPARATPSPCGSWSMRHAGVVYHAAFLPDGTYLCGTDAREVRWLGTWRLEGRVLHVREWFAGMDPGRPPSLEWSAALEPGTLRGEYRTHHGGGHGPGSFALTPPK